VNIALGKPGSRERKATIGGLSAVAVGYGLANAGLRTRNDTLLVAGVATSLAGSAAVRVSPFINKKAKPRRIRK
jgi:hypothetical protein